MNKKIVYWACPACPVAPEDGTGVKLFFYLTWVKKSARRALNLANRMKTNHKIIFSNSKKMGVGYEIDATLQDTICEMKNDIVQLSSEYIQNRLIRHIDFVIKRIKEKGAFKYKNKFYGFPVMTSQEREIIINELINFDDIGADTFEVKYSEKPQKEFCKDWSIEN